MKGDSLFEDILLGMLVYGIIMLIVLGFVWQGISMLPDVNKHEHTDSCYTADGTLLCGKDEGELYLSESTKLGPLDALRSAEAQRLEYYDNTTTEDRMKSPQAIACYILLVLCIVIFLVSLLKKKPKEEDKVVTEKEFLKIRKAFAIINGKLVFQEGGCQPSQTWLLDSYNITGEEFERTIRGALTSGRVALFHGSSYAPIDMNELPAGVLREIVLKWHELYGGDFVEIHNGCWVGEPGEIWEPVEIVGKFAV